MSPLPPPVTRGLYRGSWFEFLNALLEDDEHSAAQSLTRLRRAAQAVGVRYLSDFSRTAVFEGRRAEREGQVVRAARAYKAAIELDDTSFDAYAARIAFLMRGRQIGAALGLVPDALAALLRTREARFALFSSIALWAAIAISLTVLATILVLFVRYGVRAWHDVDERARARVGLGATLPLVLLLAIVPIAVGLGPVWILLWWGVLVFPYASFRERRILFVGLVLTALAPLLFAALGRENIIRRSPLYVAAVDLEEQREDGAAEDGLRQASSVFAEDPDVWFLLGMYAQRAGDMPRAIASYDRAIAADPTDYRAYVNRGNVRFEEGDYSEASRDYAAAVERNPAAAEALYNLSVTRGELYDFQGQQQAITQARNVSEPNVDAWSSRLTLSRVVPASYSEIRARDRIRAWNAQPKSRRLPGHLPAGTLLAAARSPATIGPVAAALLALLGLLLRRKRGVASECVRCGRPFCAACKRYGDPPLHCSPCVRVEIRKEDSAIEAHVEQTREMRRRIARRDRACRALSLFLPGAHAYFSDRPLRGAATLFAFFFALAVAVVGWRFFEIRPLAPRPLWSALTVISVIVALGLWASSNAASWRSSHGS